MRRYPSPRLDLDRGDAFLPDPRNARAPNTAIDPLARMVAEGFIASATSAEERSEDIRDAITDEENGGPFVEVDARHEFARDDEEAEPEAFPTAMRSTLR